MALHVCWFEGDCFRSYSCTKLKHFQLKVEQSIVLYKAKSLAERPHQRRHSYMVAAHEYIYKTILLAFGNNRDLNAHSNIDPARNPGCDDT